MARAPLLGPLEIGGIRLVERLDLVVGDRGLRHLGLPLDDEQLQLAGLAAPVSIRVGPVPRFELGLGDGGRDGLGARRDERRSRKPPSRCASGTAARAPRRRPTAAWVISAAHFDPGQFVAHLRLEIGGTRRSRFAGGSRGTDPSPRTRPLASRNWLWIMLGEFRLRNLEPQGPGLGEHDAGVHQPVGDLGPDPQLLAEGLVLRPEAAAPLVVFPAGGAQELADPDRLAVDPGDPAAGGRAAAGRRRNRRRGT